MKRLAFLAAVACLCDCALPGTGRADFLVAFNYSGSDSGGLDTSTGSGSFSFASSLTTVGLADLTSFNFTETFEIIATSQSSTYDYGLSDLTAFSATIGPGPTLTALSLQTDLVSPTSGPFLPDSFSVTGLGTGEASTSNSTEVVTTGTVTITSITPTPEPASLTLLGLGTAGLVGYGWRRKRTAA